MNGLGRSETDIARLARYTEEQLLRLYRKFDEEYGIPAPPPRPQEYIASIATKAKLSRDFQRRSTELLDSLDEQDLVGKKPTGLAAGALYRAARDLDVDVTQSYIAEAADVSDHTVRSGRDLIVDALSEPGSGNMLAMGGEA